MEPIVTLSSDTLSCEGWKITWRGWSVYDGKLVGWWEAINVDLNKIMVSYVPRGGVHEVEEFSVADFSKCPVVDFMHDAYRQSKEKSDALNALILSCQTKP